MNDLQFQATRAVAEAGPVGPNGKLPAIRILRGMTDKRHTLREYIDAVDWAMARPRLTLTRADKERAVKEMTARLARSAESVAYAATGFLSSDPPPLIDVFQRAQHRRESALLRLAMARTAD